MSTPKKEISPTCPICGQQAERGAIYAADKAPIRWLEGKPSISKNWDSFCGEGISISDWQLGSGVFAEGIRCQKCAKIILEEKKEPIQSITDQRASRVADC